MCVADVVEEDGEARKSARTIAAWHRCVMLDERPRIFLMAWRIAEVLLWERARECVSWDDG